MSNARDLKTKKRTRAKPRDALEAELRGALPVGHDPEAMSARGRRRAAVAELARRDAVSNGDADTWIAGAPAPIGRDYAVSPKRNGVLAFLVDELGLEVALHLTGHDHRVWSSLARAMIGKAATGENAEEAERTPRAKIARQEFAHWERTDAKHVHREKRPDERGLFAAAGRVADSKLADWRRAAVGDAMLADVVRRFNPSAPRYTARRKRLARVLRDIAVRYGPKLPCTRETPDKRRQVHERRQRLLEAIRAALQTPPPEHDPGGASMSPR